jgi:hypothetical protein
VKINLKYSQHLTVSVKYVAKLAELAIRIDLQSLFSFFDIATAKEVCHRGSDVSSQQPSS